MRTSADTLVRLGTQNEKTSTEATPGRVQKIHEHTIDLGDGFMSELLKTGVWMLSLTGPCYIHQDLISALITWLVPFWIIDTFKTSSMCPACYIHRNLNQRSPKAWYTMWP